MELIPIGDGVANNVRRSCVMTASIQGRLIQKVNCQSVNYVVENLSPSVIGRNRVSTFNSIMDFSANR
jgi:hypothetical protein